MFKQARLVVGSDPWLLIAVPGFLVSLTLLILGLDPMPGLIGLTGLLLVSAVIVRDPLVGTWLTALLTPCELRIIGANGIVSSGTDKYGYILISYLNVSPYQIVALITAAVVGLELLSGRRTWVRSSCGAPFLVLVGVMILSMLVSPYPWECFRQIVKVLLGSLPAAWIAIQTLHTRQSVRITLFAFLLGSAVNALVGLVQVFLLNAFDYRLFQNQTNLPNGLTNGSSWYGIELSYALAIALPAIWAGSTGTLRKTSFLLLPLLVGCLALSAVRTAWTSTGVVLMMTVLSSWATNRQRSLIHLALFLAVTMGTLAAAISFFPHQYSRIEEKVPQPSEPRWVTLQMALQMWHNPLLGNGFGTFMPLAADRFPELVQDHQPRGGTIFNVFLGLFFDLGLLGLLAFCWLLYRYLRVWWVSSVPREDGEGQNLRLMALTVFICWLLDAQLHEFWQSGISYFMVGLGLVLVRAAGPASAPGQPDKKSLP